MQVIVIGGGPAGMLAAISSAKNGNKVTILEKMNMLGKKLLITGKGRCNITSSLPIEDFIKYIPGNGMFMFSSFNNFNNHDIIELLEKEGVATKVERGNRVFPTSDKSQDVQKALIRTLKKLGVEIILNAKVEKILVEYKDIDENKQNEKNAEAKSYEKERKTEKNEKKFICGVIASIDGENKTILADKVVLATGGKSYPGTGSTGDGYNLAEKLRT